MANTNNISLEIQQFCNNFSFESFDSCQNIVVVVLVNFLTSASYALPINSVYYDILYVTMF